MDVCSACGGGVLFVDSKVLLLFDFVGHERSLLNSKTKMDI